MPRSGSTFLHELLAADPGNRAPRVWETMFPLPADGDPASAEVRLRRAAIRLWWFRRLAGGADEVHPLRAGSPQECEVMHSFTFLSEEFLSMCWVPSYEAWLRQADFVPAYAWQKRFLQHLQGPQPARWVLKSPDHAHCLGPLFTVFPDATIVQTHREPGEVLASSLQLIEVLHRVFARAAGREARAEREGRVLAEAMERILDFREARPELRQRFIDVTYAELVADPLQTVRRIYAQWGRELTPAAETAMRQLAAQRSRYTKRRVLARSAKPVGPLADLSCFERYRRSFNLPLSRRTASSPS
jgi:hypothetical protein